MSKHEQATATVEVFDGEVCVFLTSCWRDFNKMTLAEQILYRKNNNHGYSREKGQTDIPPDGKGPYSIHRGEFRFHYRKTFSPGGNGGVEGHDDEARFYGEYFVDSDYTQRTRVTRVVL